MNTFSDKLPASLRLIVTVLSMLLLGVGCSSNPVRYTHRIPYDPALPMEGAAKYDGSSDVVNSPYYKAIDFYNKKSSGSLILIENFKTIQQLTEVTCGPVCVLMVLEHYGKRNGLNEKQLQQLRKTEQAPTNLQQLINIFDSLGGFDYKSTYDYEEASPKTFPENFFLEYLKQGIPVIIGTSAWNGHWQIVIGYDTMGTPNTADDVLIMAEPYDTTDHCQDGYITFPLQHLFEGTWHSRFDPDYKWGLFLAVWPK